MHTALKETNIPFDRKTNKKIASLYITPNAIIITHTFAAVWRGSGLVKLAKRISSIDAFNIYLHLENITNQHHYDMFIKDISRKINIKRLNIINDLSQVPQIPDIFNYNFGIIHCGAIWTLVMERMHDTIMGRPILVPQNIYNRAIAIMDESELERLHTYNIIITDDHPSNTVYIIMDTNNNKEPFVNVIKFIPLDGGQRSVIRIIENMTSQCENCQKIVYLDKLHNC